MFVLGRFGSMRRTILWYAPNLRRHVSGMTPGLRATVEFLPITAPKTDTTPKSSGTICFPVVDNAGYGTVTVLGMQPLNEYYTRS